jgi:hypothetical protein
MENSLLSILQNIDTSFIVSLLCIGVVVTLFLVLRQSRQLRQQRKDNRDLRQQMRALTSAALGMGERVLEMERRQKHLAERQDQVDIYESANQPYEQAIRMSQHGASISELVNDCGVSENEAHLIDLMSRLDKAS